MAIQELTGAEEENWSLRVGEASLAVLALVPLALRYGCGDRSSLAWFRFGIRFRRPAAVLGQMFPLPSDVESDANARSWVEGRRAEWLLTDPEDESALLHATRTILQG